MSSLVYGKSKEVAKWVGERIPFISGGFGLCEAIGVLSKDSGNIIAGVVYHDYYPEYKNIQLSIASSNPMWARMGNIISLLEYPFEQLGVYKCGILTPIDNKKSLRFTKHLGFTVEAILDHQFGQGCHAVASRMLLPEFKKIKEKYHGKRIEFTTTSA